MTRRAEARRSWALAATLSLAAVFAFATPAAALEPLAEIGTSGSGAGQLASPSGVAIDAAGNLFVAEAGNSRMSQFTPQGGFTRAFGFDVVPGGGTGFEVCTAATGCKAGTPGGGAGQLDAPVGVATAAAGRLFVTDAENHRVSQFTPQGGFARAFGFDVIPGGGTGFEVCTAATGCKAGVLGGAAGQLRFPSGVATDAVGRLFVAELENHRVSQFTSQGGFARAFGWDVVPGGGTGTGFEVCTAGTACKAGTPGGGAGQLSSSSSGVATDAAGRLFVANSNNNRVSQFTPQGGFVRAFGYDVLPTGGTGFEVCTAATGCKAGTSGGGVGQLASPQGVATDAAGRLSVTEFGNQRVSQFTPQGGFARAFGFDVVPGGGTGFEVCTAATGCKAGTLGGAAGQLFNPRGVTTDCRGSVYVAELAGDRVQRFGEAGTPPPPCPSGGGDPSPPSNEFSFGKAKKNKKRGMAKLTVIVPGPGDIELAKTEKVKGDGERAEARGSVKLVVNSKGKAKRKLNRRGRAKVKVEVTYAPDGGTPNTESTKIKLVKKTPPRRRGGRS